MSSIDQVRQRPAASDAAVEGTVFLVLKSKHKEHEHYEQQQRDRPQFQRFTRESVETPGTLRVQRQRPSQ